MFDPQNPFMVPPVKDNFFTPPGGRTKPPAPASLPTVDKPGEGEGRDLANEKKRLEIEEARREAERIKRLGPTDTEKQDLAAGFLGRMINSDALYGEGILPRSAEFQTMRDATPTNLSKAYQYSPKERAAKNYIDDFIRAKLRVESGAVIGDDEMDREYKLYFPMPGDTEEDLKRKRDQRAQAINGMKILAGPSVENTAVRGGKDIHGNEVVPIPSGSPVITEPDFPTASATPLDLSGLEGPPRPGGPVVPEGEKPPPATDAVAATTDDPWPLGEKKGDWVRTGADVILNVKTNERSTYGGYPQGDPKEPPPPKPDNSLTNDFLKGAGSVAEGVGNVGGLITNPITAGVNWAAGREVMGAPDLGRSLRETLHLPANEGLSGAITEAGTGALTMAGGASALARAPSILANPMQTAVANVLAKEPIRQATGAIGGVLAGEGARAAGAPVPVQIAANVLGSVAGYGKVPPVAGRGRDPALAAASIAEDVPISKPMFDPRTRAKAGNLESSTGSSERVRSRMADTVAGVEGGVRRIQGPGQVLETPDAGSIVQRSAQRFIDRSRATAGQLYDRARALAGPDATITPRAILRQMREELKRLGQAKNVRKEEIAFINDLGKDLTDGPLTVDGFRAIREGIRGRIDTQGLTATQADAAAMRILDAARTDGMDSLPRAASVAFRRADTYYAQRMAHIDDVLAKFIAPNKAGQPTLSGEQAFNKLVSMANPKTGDSRRMAAMWRSMAPDEQDDMVATIMDGIGRAKGEGSNPFSTDRFLTQIANYSPAARRAMFGPRGAESIENLILLSDRVKAARSEFNVTKSGKVIKQGWGKAVGALLLGGGGGAWLGGAVPAAAVGGGALAASLAFAGFRNLQARTLMNPAFSRWLAGLPDANTPRQMSEYLTRLGTVIARNPELADELQPVKDKLEKTIGVVPPDRALTTEATR